MTTYYKFDSSKLSLAETWTISPNPVVFLIQLFRRLFGLYPRPRFGYALDRIQIVSWEQLPEEARASLTPIVTLCERLEMRLVFCYTMAFIGRQEGYAAALLSHDGTTWSGVLWLKVQAGRAVKVRTYCQLVSEREEGIFLVTSNNPNRLDRPEWAESVHRPGASVQGLFTEHARRLKAAGLPQIRTVDDQGLQAFIARFMRRTHEHLIRRGIWVPMSDAEIAVLQANE
jgi:hypothetical protein